MEQEGYMMHQLEGLELSDSTVSLQFVAEESICNSLSMESGLD